MRTASPDVRAESSREASRVKNAEDVLALADQVGLDLPTLIETIGASSGGSAALRALGTDITPDLAEHLR